MIRVRCHVVLTCPITAPPPAPGDGDDVRGCVWLCVCLVCGHRRVLASVCRGSRERSDSACTVPRRTRVPRSRPNVPRRAAAPAPTHTFACARAPRALCGGADEGCCVAPHAHAQSQSGMQSGRAHRRRDVRRDAIGTHAPCHAARLRATFRVFEENSYVICASHEFASVALGLFGPQSGSGLSRSGHSHSSLIGFWIYTL